MIFEGTTTPIVRKTELKNGHCSREDRQKGRTKPQDFSDPWKCGNHRNFSSAKEQTALFIHVHRAINQCNVLQCTCAYGSNRVIYSFDLGIL